jgi:hypothetical protein
MRGRTVFSGHIHTPSERPGRFNLGSCYSLNFADANSVRGFYIIKDGKIVFKPNEVSINFYRIYNEDILERDLSKLKSEDYIELYITEINMSKEQYINAIKKYTEKFSHIWIIPQVVANGEFINEDFTGYDIEAIMESSIPEDLIDFYNKIKYKMKTKGD